MRVSLYSEWILVHLSGDNGGHTFAPTLSPALTNNWTSVTQIGDTSVTESNGVGWGLYHVSLFSIT